MELAYWRHKERRKGKKSEGRRQAGLPTLLKGDDGMKEEGG